jgi:hypothetical protein
VISQRARRGWAQWCFLCLEYSLGKDMSPPSQELGGQGDLIYRRGWAEGGWICGEEG